MGVVAPLFMKREESVYQPQVITLFSLHGKASARILETRIKSQIQGKQCGFEPCVFNGQNFSV